MRASRFAEAHIAQVLQDQEAKLADLVRRQGVTEQTLYRWKNKPVGPQVNEAKRPKTLEEKSRQLKRLVAHQALHLQVVADRLAKNGARQTRGGRRSRY
jgi:putative transposase